MDTRARFRGLAGWAVLGALVLSGLGAASAEPAHVLVRIPAWPAVLLVVASVVLAARLLGVDAGAPLVGLSIPLVLLWTAGMAPGVRALSGPPLLALAAAGVVTLVAARGWTPPPRLLFPVVLALYAAIALRVQTSVGPHGDEPHYLMVAESILRDGDLELTRDYEEADRYRAFTAETLTPHYRVRGHGGEIYSVHAVGLSLLVLPAYALAGYPGVSFFMALLAALLVRELRELLRESSGSERVSEGVGWLLAFSPPLVHFVGLVFTEVPAALVIARGLRMARQAENGTWRILSWAAPLVLLPWFNVRYAPVTAILLLYALTAKLPRRQAVLLVLAAGASAVAIGAYHFVLYGFVDPRLVWGRRPEFAMATLWEGLPGLALDQEFGLLPYAPILALCAAGFIRMARDHTRQAWAALALAAIVIGTAGSWHMWRGGFNPPARFLVPLLPVFGLGVAAALRGGSGAAAVLLAGWSLWAGALGAIDPALVHRDRDGTAPFFRAWSGAEEWTRLFPGYVLPETAGDRTALALVWVSVLGIAVIARRRSLPTAGGLAAASVVLIAGAAVASAVSEGRTGGRDAVRLIGRRSMSVPGWRVVCPADATWGPSVLRWGTLYEPHRHPDGAEIGARLRLPRGRYRIDLDVEWVGFEADSAGPRTPGLEVRPEGTGKGRTYELVRVPSGLSGAFDIVPTDPAVSLRLREGSAFTLSRIRLSTFS